MIGNKFISRYGFETSGSSVLANTVISGSLTDGLNSTGSNNEVFIYGTNGTNYGTEVKSSSYAASASIATNLKAGGQIPVVTSNDDFDTITGSRCYIVYNEDKNYRDFTANTEGSFTNINNYTTVSTTVTATNGYDSTDFTATINSVFNASYGIGRAFGEGVGEHAIYGALDGVLALTGFTQTGIAFSRLRFRGRASNDYWRTCDWTVSYNDADGNAATFTGTTTTTQTAEYHDFSWDSRGITITRIDLALSNAVGINYGVSDFDVFFPTPYDTGLYYSLNGTQTKALP